MMDREVKVGDWMNDWDCKFPAGEVKAVDPAGAWFEVEWERGGARYIKRHDRSDLKETPTAGFLVKI